MKRRVKNKFIPTEIVSKILIGTAPNGQTKNLIKIDQVDQFIPTGENKAHIRLQLFNDKESVDDSFFFSLDEGMELKSAFIQTTESNMKLLEWEMALSQDQVNLNEFIKVICEEYFQKELGYSNFRII